MHSAPSVTYPVGRSAFQQRLEHGCRLAWLLVLLFWWQSLATAQPPAAWWCLLLFGGGLWAWGHVQNKHRPQHGTLCWETDRPVADPTTFEQVQRLPGRWLWFSPAYRHGSELTQVLWAFDFQQHVLLRLENAAGLRWWVWLSHDTQPDAWHALRVALVSWRGPAESVSAETKSCKSGT